MVESVGVVDVDDLPFFCTVARADVWLSAAGRLTLLRTVGEVPPEARSWGVIGGVD